MSGAKVAVIEDDADILELIVYNLQRDGYRTATARSGIDAWELINRERPDIVLLDLMLPGLDGIEICRRLKSSPDTEPISVIIVSA
jgi:DNA-binding response OmpR family regulator